MIQAPEILSRIQNGADSITQFEVDMTDANLLAEELAAFSNTEGGMLLIGVDDNGVTVGLNNQQISRIKQLISNAADENVKPPVYPFTEIVEIGGKRIVVVSARKGESRPYQTSKGHFFSKSGSDRRKMSSEELRRLFAASQRLFADEEALAGSTVGDINSETVYDFLDKDNPDVLEELKRSNLSAETVFTNLGLLNDGVMTLAGNLLFGKVPSRFTPSFYVDCVHFAGDSVDVDHFIDK